MSLVQPTRDSKRRAASRPPKRTLSLLGLAPNGGYLAAHITADAGGLLHHLFTMTLLRELFVSVVRSDRYHLAMFPRPGRYPTLCPMECGLSSIPRTGPRLPDRPEVISSYTRARRESTVADQLKFLRFVYNLGHSPIL